MSIEADIQIALVRHASFRDSGTFRAGPNKRWFCSCGQMIDEEPSGRDIARRHRKHLASVIAQYLTSQTGEDDALALALWGHRDAGQSARPYSCACGWEPDRAKAYGARHEDVAVQRAFHVANALRETGVA